MSDTKFNGWKNYETWNVALYIQNDEYLYRLARKCKNYKQFLARGAYGDLDIETADGVRWDSKKISRREINEMLRELR